MRKLMKILLFPFLFFFVIAGAQPANAAPPTYPPSIAALGDSITQATDVCCWYGNHPAQSWSTGDGQFDGISSHYERLVQLQPGSAVTSQNLSVSGAKAVDLVQQAGGVTAGTGYVTILIGANDLCTSSAGTMTSESDFRNSVSQALAILKANNPTAKIFVSSIPDIYQLWSVLRTSATAQLVWSAAQICQSMLAPSNTEEMRQQVVQREAAFNRILAEVCGQYDNCRTDRNAVTRYKFTSGDVSRLDYFHPSLQGQAKLADITWKAAW
ncbi:SGNH/GDSL hydrolase family protein [Arthrobacter sp. AD-310]